MPTTYVDYTATAAQTDFAFTFPYLEDEHVIVEIDGSATTAFSIVTTPSTKIVLDSGATDGQVVRVRRKSQPDTNLVDFENGSVLTESELDRAYLHNRYLNEEIAELNDASLQKAPGTDDWDAGGSKIINVGTPTLTADATTKDYVDAKVNQASTGSSFPPLKWQFTGTAGANTTYSVTGAEIDGDTAYDVSVDGLVKEPGVDFTVDPDTDTLTIVPTLSGGEDIVIIQRGFGLAISTGSIGEDQLQTDAVSTAKIQNDAVSTAKLADHSVTAVKISNTDPTFNVQTNGDVGIGTSSPATNHKLHIKNTETANFRIERNKVGHTNSQNGYLQITAAEGSNLIYSKDLDDNDKNFVIDAGNVGIGTTTPTQKLTLAETSNGDNVLLHFQARNTSATDLNSYIIYDPDADFLALSANQSLTGIGIDVDGNVGIGTNSPSAPLEVTSTTGGVVFPRLNESERDAISSPTDGETIFNTTTNRVESYNGSSWEASGGEESTTVPTGTTVATSGTTTLPGGLIMKFGKGISTTTATETFTFPTAFPNNHFCTTVSMSSAGQANPLGAFTTTLTGFSIDRNNLLLGNVEFNFISIGN